MTGISVRGRAQAPSQNTQILFEEAQTLEVLNRVGNAVAAELDLDRVVQVVTDAATELSHAAFGAFFYNVIDAAGEAYTLYALSGVPREAFAKFPMPRNTAVFAPTFRGEGIVRSADITKDPRYAKNDPYFGMPEGHLPVRSYLATSVVSRTGEVLGGLFFGHPEAGIFTERAERIVASISVQAGIAIDKARLYRAAQEEIERRKRVEVALRESEETLEARVADRTAQLAASNARLLAEAQEREKAEGRFGLLVDGIVDYAIYMLDPTGVITNWNTGAQRIKGYASEEIVGRHFSAFFTEEDRAAALPAKALQTAAREGRFEAEGWRVRKDGSRFWANALIDAIRDKSGQLLGFAKITRDITERRDAMIALRQAQELLAQAQKMEGLGQLTGGVAHDFNNMLATIQGSIELLQERLAGLPGVLETPDVQRFISAALRGTSRAALLTHRLLAFARRQPLAPSVVAFNKLVSGMSDLLQRTLGETVAIETVLAGGLWDTFVDVNQFESALVNLAVNARDAMPDGGKLTIETANCRLDEDYAAAQGDIQAGQYVGLCISDTGVGMPKEIVAKAFEPFFTTKEVGHGTGLGLSQVYGFIRQSGGHIRIYSEVGQGTTVKLYLPRHQAADVTATDGKPEPRELALAKPGEAILVVEDDPDVRSSTTALVGNLGYRVVSAGDGLEALRLLDADPELQLLFTDVGLPRDMNGRQLADEARRRRPKLKVLFTTGYARDAIVHHGRLDPGVEVIFKPFNRTDLAARLRQVFDRR